MVRDEVEWEERVWRRKEARLTFCVGVAVLVGWRGLVVGLRTKREVVAQAILRDYPLYEKTLQEGRPLRERHCLWSWII